MARLAYYDTFSGLVPCRVLQVVAGEVTVKLTGSRRAYKRGEILTGLKNDNVVPRHRVFTRGGQAWVSTGWDWSTGEGTTPTPKQEAR